MFAQWFMAGVAFGFKVFFAGLVFVLCNTILMALFAALTGGFRGESGGDDDDLDRM